MRFTVYGKPSCSYCEQAKNLLSKCDLEYTYIDLSLDGDKLEEFRSNGFRTVPIIYSECGKLVGGFSELQDYLLDSLG